jgi:hypothetical protein
VTFPPGTSGDLEQFTRAPLSDVAPASQLDRPASVLSAGTDPAIWFHW